MSVPQPRPRPGADGPVAEVGRIAVPRAGAKARATAFRAADRHSVRVRILRRVIIAGSTLVILGLAAVLWFDPFRRLPAGVSLDSVAINGSTITMQLPKLTGFKKDGSPYEVKARSGTQDVRTPTIIDLADIDAKISMSDKTSIHMVAPRGTYDSTKDTMVLPRDVRVTSDAGYDVALQSARMDFKAGTVVSDDPVQVVTKDGTVASDRVDISDGGKKIAFSGHVRSTMQGSSPTPAPAGGAKP